MCVAITLAPKASLTREEVERMNRSNSDGVGVAWAHNGTVSWFKTTKVEPQYIERLIYYWSEFPRLVHFRLATAGGTRSDLCHPFEVGPLASCRTQGTSNRVMIHNGHWSKWEEVKSLLDSEDLLPDKGPWSDSRLAAFLAHQDPDWFQALGGRVATMDGEGVIKRLGDWTYLRDGIHVSNKIWDYNSQNNYKRGGYEGYRDWPGWEWTEGDWEAYMKESEEREKKHAEELRRAAEAEKLEEEAKAKAKGKKRADSPSNQSSGNSGPSHGTGQITNGAVVSFAGGGTVVDYHGNGARYYNREPYYNARDGKWYQYDDKARSVVEVAPPSASGPARRS